MNSTDLVERLARDHDLPDGELLALIGRADADEALFAAADKARRAVYGDKVYLRGDVDEWNFSAVLVRNGILRGCVAYNRTDDVRAVRRIMHDGLAVSLEHLTDPELDLTELADEAAAHKENA